VSQTANLTRSAIEAYLRFTNKTKLIVVLALKAGVKGLTKSTIIASIVACNSK
jgi:hypothetical protein